MVKNADEKGKRGTAGKKKSTDGEKGAAKPAQASRNASMAIGDATLDPVSLQEARALIASERPSLAVRSMSAPREAVSLEPVGIARSEVAARYRDEIERRYDDYTRLLDLMTKRGAKRIVPPSQARAAVTWETFSPLIVLAEGDSWFDYPVPFFGGGVIPRLEERLGVPILNLAKAGDEVRYMLGVEQRERLARILKKGDPAGKSWEVLLFSGGGNDIVDNPMALWIKDWDPALPPEQLLNSARFDAALSLVLAGYEDLIALRDKLSPETHVIFHSYDFAIPDGRGICHLGPWLKPTFDLRGFRTRSAMSAVVETMLRRFADQLAVFAKKHKNVTFINTQGTLARKTSSWHNELHPEAKGFDKFADMFYKQIKSLFPTRVT